MYPSACRGAVTIAGFALSELAEIRQQFAGICEERMGHLLWQHCMLTIAAAFPNPHAGPSWTTSTASSNTVSTLRIDMILYPFLDFGKSRDEQCRDNEEGIATGIVLPRLIELAMRQKNLIPFREGVLGVACGRVLEIGLGPISSSPHTLGRGRGLWSQSFDPASGENQQMSQYRANISKIG